MAFRSFREESKVNWGRETDGNPLTREEIQDGALLRIADAIEAMAHNYVGLINERDRYKRWYDCERVANLRNKRRIAAFQGIVKRLKRQLCKKSG